MSTTLFALCVEAVADKGSALPQDQQRSLLVLAKAASREDALSIAMIVLAENHWTKAQMTEVAPLSIHPSLIEDRIVREAALHAAENGRAIVVF